MYNDLLESMKSNLESHEDIFTRFRLLDQSAFQTQSHFFSFAGTVGSPMTYRSELRICHFQDKLIGPLEMWK